MTKRIGTDSHASQLTESVDRLGYASRTDERTNGLTESSTHLGDESFSFVTRGHVQDFRSNVDDERAKCQQCGGDMPATTSHKTTPRKFCTRECGWAAKRAQSQATLTATIEEVEFLTEAGESLTAIAQRLDLKPSALSRRLYRAERPDLAAPFGNLRTRSGKGSCGSCGAPVWQGNRRCFPCGIRERGRVGAA